MQSPQVNLRACQIISKRLIYQIWIYSILAIFIITLLSPLMEVFQGQR
jgi:hypothetical protein